VLAARQRPERFVAAVETSWQPAVHRYGQFGHGGEIMTNPGTTRAGSRAVHARVGEGIAHVKTTLRNFAAQGRNGRYQTSVATTISENERVCRKIRCGFGNRADRH
jgi:hypothetical protein